MLATRSIGAAVFTLVLLLSGGCVFPDSAVIRPGDGDDLGDSFALYTYAPPGGSGISLRLQFQRSGKSSYLMQVFFPDVVTDNHSSFRGWVDFKGEGEVEGSQIYVVQLRSESEKLAIGDRTIALGILRKSGDGAAVFALIDCHDPFVEWRARVRGVELVCLSNSPFEASSHPLSTNGNLLAFLEDILKLGLFRWEDEAGVSLINEVFQGI